MDCSITQFPYLQASFQVFILHPCHTNINKELMKTPKLYLTDTGPMCALIGLGSPGEVRDSEYAGAVLETAVVNEIRKRLAHEGRKRTLHFWRTAAGTEVDLLVQHCTKKIALEIKKTMTPRKKHISSLTTLFNDLPDTVTGGYLVHTGDTETVLGGRVAAVPVGRL